VSTAPPCVFCRERDPNGTTFHVRGKLPFRACAPHAKVVNETLREVGVTVRDFMLDELRRRLLPTKVARARMSKILKSRAARALLGLDVDG
jgi:hypothetical protein